MTRAARFALQRFPKTRELSKDGGKDWLLPKEKEGWKEEEGELRRKGRRGRESGRVGDRDHVLIIPPRRCGSLVRVKEVLVAASLAVFLRRVRVRVRKLAGQPGERVVV